MKIEIELSQEELLTELGKQTGDIGFIVDVVDNMARNYNQMSDVILALFKLCPEGIKDEIRVLIND
jgi:hypothetical protein